jgi:hypothetical protein
MILGCKYYEIRPRLLLHIPKTGGTWLNDQIIQNGVMLRKLRIKQLKHATTVSDISSVYGPNSKFGFIFRDPVDRLHSAFDSRRNFSRPVRDIPWRPEEAICFGAFQSFDEFASAFAGKNSRMLALAETALQRIPHFHHGMTYYFGDIAQFGPLHERIAMCIETTNLDRALDQISQVYGIPPLTRTENARYHSSKPVRSPLSVYGRDVLRDRLTSEYAIYHACRSLQASLHPSL